MTESRPRRLSYLIYISLAVLIIFVFLAYHYISTGRHLRYLEDLIEEKTGLEANIERLKIKGDGIWVERLTLSDHDAGIGISVPLINISEGFSALMGGKRLGVRLISPVLSLNPGKIFRAKILKKRG
ncbi:MAG: hypothetical protein D6726_07405, partial [Nitrospirae bacterium]